MNTLEINEAPKVKAALVNDGQFYAINNALNSNFALNVTQAEGKVFKVKLARNELYEKYLSLFEQDVRQEYNCTCCKSFMRKYGDLVTINPQTGETKSAMWNINAQTAWTSSDLIMFNKVFVELARLVESAEVDYNFSIKPDQKYLGSKTKGGFEHFYLKSDFYIDPVGGTKESKQQDFTLLKGNLVTFKLDIINLVNTYFEKDVILKRFTRFSRSIRLFKQLADKYHSTKNTNLRDNLIWDFVATYNKSVINIGNTVGGMFMTRLMFDVPISIAKAEFLKAADPLNYMRPTEAAKAGTIAAAEKLFIELDIESALKRRFATFEDIPEFVWKPTEVVEPIKPGIFSELLPKKTSNLPEIDGGTVTWSVFAKQHLPKAKQISVKFSSAHLYYFGSLITAEDPMSKPIFKYDSEDKRNQFSDFITFKSEFGKASGLGSTHFVSDLGYIEVSGIITGCELFNKENDFSQVTDVRLILKGRNHPGSKTLCIFPESLRHELYPVRSVIENYSNQKEVTGRENSILTVLPIATFLKVTTDDAVISYVIDRLE